MSMTLADWNAWSIKKRKFYVALFTAYYIADDGVLCKDVKKRRDLVRAQLDEQATPGSEQIFTSSFSANYVIIDGLQSDGQTLKAAEASDDLKVLCSKYIETTKKSNQHTLVGGFKPQEQTIREHFKTVIKQKMCNGAEVESKGIAESAILLPLAKTYDLTFFSRCALHPDEKLFLLEDILFKEAIKEEAARLLQLHKGLHYSAAQLEQCIIENINISATDLQNQQSLGGLSVPLVETFLALYTTKKFRSIEQYVTGILSQRDPFAFKGYSAPLTHFLVEGVLSFTFLSEVRNLLKALFILKGPLAGQTLDVIKDRPEKMILLRESIPVLIDIMIKITNAQIGKIKEGQLPILPRHMGIEWDHRSPTELLKLLKSMHAMNLHHMADLAGFSFENAHQAFGLACSALVDEMNVAINQVWALESESLLRGIERFLESVRADAGEKVLAAPHAQVTVLLPAEPTTQVGPATIGMFAASTIEIPLEQPVPIFPGAGLP